MTHEGGKVVSYTHRPPLPPGNIPGTHLCYRLCRPQVYIAAGRIMSMTNSNDTVGNRTRDLPTCSAVPQQTASPRHRVHLSVLNRGECTVSCIKIFRNTSLHIVRPAVAPIQLPAKPLIPSGGGIDCFEMVHDRDIWRTLVSAVMNLRVP